jgi:glutathione S-transferase
VLDYLRDRAVADLDRLDRELSQAEFLASPVATIADLSCAGYLWWIREAGLTLDDHPHVERWLERISRLPQWQHPDRAMRP